MNLKSILRCNHDLKKNGYKIIRKLHKLESRKNLDKVYIRKCREGYFAVLSFVNLISLIQKQYSDNKDISFVFNEFMRKSNIFLHHLEYVSENRIRVNRHKLSSYLSSYTDFFNTIIQLKVPFNITQEVLIDWNRKCVMAYYAVWSK